MKTANLLKRLSLFSVSFVIAALAIPAQAEKQTVIISINKSAPLQSAPAVAAALQQVDPTLGTCYFEAILDQYIAYPSCEKDATCPYWGVALVDVSWECSQSLPALQKWIEKVQANPDYSFYSNSPIGPFPIISGGN